MTFEFHWRREYPLWYGVAAIYGMVTFIREETGRDVAGRGEGRGGWFAILSEGENIRYLHEVIGRKFLSDDAYVERSLRGIHAAGERIMRAPKEFHISAATTNAQLFAFAATYFYEFKRFCTNLFRSFYFVEIVSGLFTQLVEREAPGELVPQVIEAYSEPSQRAVLLQLGEFFERHQDRDERIAYVQRTYPCIGNIDPFIEPYDREQTAAYVDSYQPPRARPAPPITLSDERLVRLYQEILYLKDRRDDYRRLSFVAAVPLMREIARRLGIRLADVGYLFPEELGAPNAKELIAQRKRGYIAELKDGKLTVRAGDLLGEFVSEERGDLADEVRGTVGCRGKIRGRVQLVRTKDDIPRFEKGNVFVAVTTSPEHIVAMQRAIAFVTDEGGIACHAAIVAREFGIPCVVGARRATATFRDGDLVEVDADKGVVRRL
jgi:phosphohistidine swiveling domain-containing protein